ncbi:nuclear transport factor 2 family protein [Paracoccus sp. M683]|uniref:nuclear transport factor 2 family protein n=1 Tax=Paracoccus sp. M683 TaxID=2594268 RepID=UPI001180284C|nr:nuclear transport factor 2 family protein [Paracoccus sp. M683]TRW99232.1 nuclear transport factor 2 family protein [Paracoccus sp. M683]
MLKTDLPLNPAVLASLRLWHQMIATRDLSRLAEITAPDAVFRSPTVLRGFESAPALALALQTVLTVFEDFSYHREFAGDDGHSVVLEFSARVGDKSLKGIDMIRFDADGRIVDFEVMIRPLNALQLLYAAMTEKLGPALVAFKGKG